MTLLLHPDESRTSRLLDLTAHGDRVAVRTAEETLTYAALANRVDAAAGRLGATRRLVLVEGANTLPAMVGYLAALTAGHVVLLAAPGRPAAELTDAWDPDVVLRGDQLDERRPGTRHELHPDLALLLSTSGSTGAPKLVRLSADNLASNAASIATYLRLTPEDRAITSLPLHYCYGLSVVHSHLLAGAGLVLTDLSVVDDCFWRLAADGGATSFSGVPYTFDLLERSGFDERRLPSLRYVTQAGGRFAPDRVRAWAERGRRSGWELVVMYGQTEATARMAWLPPELVVDHPGSIGVPVPGGSFRIDPVGDAGPGVGELVYRGPNVMMGYAEHAADLGRPAELAELRTGDLAREVDGLVEVVGRRGRHAKLFGLRLDLDHLERQVGADTEVRCVVVDDTLHAFLAAPRLAGRVRAALAAAGGLPSSAIRVTVLPELPRTPSGKPDLSALAGHARLVTSDSGDSGEPGGVPLLEAVRRDYALVLGRPEVATDESFAGLGGDSLSYVELATRLRRRLGDLPPDWHTRPIADLAAAPARRRGTAVETSVVLRALAILAIVGTHANLWTVLGGAHLLLAVAGHNFARFQLAGDRSQRLRHGLASMVQLVLPASLWIGAVALATGYYQPATAFFLNGALGSDDWTVQWQFWFLEALLWATAGSLAVMAVPAVDRLERRSPYALAIGLVVAGLAVRFAWVGLEAGATGRYTVGVVAWWFLAGWAAQRADTTGRRWLVVALAALGTVGFFGDPVREALIIGGVALLAHVRTVRLPARLVAPVSVVASASLFVYLTHWQVYPHLEDSLPLLATLLSLLVGTGCWWVSRAPLRWVGRQLRR